MAVPDIDAEFCCYPGVVLYQTFAPANVADVKSAPEQVRTIGAFECLAFIHQAVLQAEAVEPAQRGLGFLNQHLRQFRVVPAFRDLCEVGGVFICRVVRNFRAAVPLVWFHPVEQISEPTDYRAVDGVKVPFKIVNTSPNQTVAITITKIENNVALDDAIFVSKGL